VKRQFTHNAEALRGGALKVQTAKNA